MRFLARHLHEKTALANPSFDIAFRRATLARDFPSKEPQGIRLQ
jgi:hypothetical protein